MNGEPNPNSKMWAGIIVVIVMVPAYIYMKANNIDDEGLMYLLGPIATYMLIGAKVEQVTQEQNHTLNKIQEQTNGVLDKRIRDGVKAALAEREKEQEPTNVL